MEDSDSAETKGRRMVVMVYEAAVEGEPALRQLLATGVDVDSSIEDGWTALHHAAACGSSQCVVLLVKAGADVNRPNNEGWTALHGAAASGNSQSVLHLVKAGADINIPTNEGVTPLHMAVQSNDSNMVSMLLAIGVDPSDWEALKRATADLELLELLDTASKRGKVELTKEAALTELEKFVHKDNCRVIYDGKHKYQLITSLNKKILVVGKQGSGKSSMCRTLAYFKQLTNMLDRTSVLELLNLVTKHKDGTLNTSVIYDVGGHDCYQYTTNIFAMNSSNNTIICTHDITDSNFRIPYSWLKSLLFKCHKCQWIFVLTKVDMYPESEVLEKRAKFIYSMAVKLEKEIKHTEATKAKVAAEPNKYVAKLHDLENVIEACRRIKTSLESEKGIFMISCKSINKLINETCAADQTEKLREHLVEVIPSTGHRIPKVYHDFYTQLGTLGIRTSMEITSQQPKTSGKEIGTKYWKQKMKPIRVEKKEMTSTKARTETTESTRILVYTRCHEAEKLFQDLQKSTKTATKTTDSPRPLIYTRRDEAEKLFQDLLNDAITDGDITEEDAQLLSVDECIQHFHTVGVIFGFTSTPKQREIIYNDVGTFVDMLKSIFDHKIYTANNEEVALTWDKLTEMEQAQFEKKSDFTEARKALSEKGFMYSSVLKLLLSRHKFHDKYKHLIDLLSSLYLCHQLNETGDIFVPFYCENIPINTQTKTNLAWIAASDKESLSVAIWMEGYISSVMYCKILVGLHKALGLKLDQKIVKMWGQGAFLWLGNVAIALIYNIENGMFVIFKASATFSAVSSMWQAVNEFDILANNVIEPENPGAIINLVVLCPNCIALKESESGKLIKIIIEMACYKEENSESTEDDVEQEGASIAIDELFECMTLKDALSDSCFAIGTVHNCKSADNLNAVICHPPQTGAQVKGYSRQKEEDFEKRLRATLKNYPKGEEQFQKQWGESFFGNIQQRSKDDQKSTTGGDEPKTQTSQKYSVAPNQGTTNQKTQAAPEVYPRTSDPLGLPAPDLLEADSQFYGQQTAPPLPQFHRSTEGVRHRDDTQSFQRETTPQFHGGHSDLYHHCYPHTVQTQFLQTTADYQWPPPHPQVFRGATQSTISQQLPYLTPTAPPLQEDPSQVYEYPHSSLTELTDLFHRSTAGVTTKNDTQSFQRETTTQFHGGPSHLYRHPYPYTVYPQFPQTTADYQRPPPHPPVFVGATQSTIPQQLPGVTPLNRPTGPPLQEHVPQAYEYPRSYLPEQTYSFHRSTAGLTHSDDVQSFQRETFPQFHGGPSTLYRHPHPHTVRAQNTANYQRLPPPVLRGAPLSTTPQQLPDPTPLNRPSTPPATNIPTQPYQEHSLVVQQLSGKDNPGACARPAPEQRDLDCVVRELHNIALTGQAIAKQTQETAKQTEETAMQVQEMRRDLNNKGNAVASEIVTIGKDLADKVEHQEQVQEKRQQALQRDIRLHAGDASSLEVNFKHEILERHKKDLIEHVDASDELLKNLKNKNLITSEVYSNLSCVAKEENRVKRILLSIQDLVEDKDLCEFIAALEESKLRGSNEALAKLLKKSYDDRQEGNISNQ